MVQCEHREIQHKGRFEYHLSVLSVFKTKTASEVRRRLSEDKYDYLLH